MDKKQVASKHKNKTIYIPIGNSSLVVALLHTEQVRYGFYLFLRPVQELLVHVRPQIARVGIALHQIENVVRGHVEAPTARASGALLDRFPGQFQRLGVDVDRTGRVRGQILVPDRVGGVLDLGLRQGLHLLDRFPKSAKRGNEVRIRICRKICCLLKGRR